MSYQDTMGFRQDKGRFFQYLDRISTALETLADNGKPFYEEQDEDQLLVLKIKTGDEGWTNVVDSLNENLRALAMAGDIDDLDDEGWKWSGQAGNEIKDESSVRRQARGWPERSQTAAQRPARTAPEKP